MSRNKKKQEQPSGENTESDTPEIPAIKDRIVEFTRIKASELKPHPQNLRNHGDEQRAAMQGMLDSIGYAGACIAIKREDGYVLLDGHLRAETTPDTLIPVLIVDLDDNEALAMLVGHDRIGELAEWDYESVVKLTDKLKSNGIDLANLGWSDAELDAIMGMEEDETPEIEDDEKPIGEIFQILIECASESEQKLFYEQFQQQGKKCKLLTL